MKNKSLTITYAWLLCFGAVPFVIMIISSCLSKDSVQLIALPFTISNYINLASPEILRVFIRSISLATITTLLCLLIAYPFSYLLVKSKLQSLLLLLIIIPFWTSTLVRTYALLSILKFNGLINSLLIKLHLINLPLNILYSNFAVVVGLVYALFPLMVLPLFNNMKRFDFRLFEAAKDLGARPLDIFLRVFLPNTKKGIIAGSTLIFLPAMTLFYIPNILGGARSMMLGNLIEDEFLENNNWPQGSATSVVLILLVIVLAWLMKSRRA